jgi:sec-independent protein translocase protein TatC
MVSDAEKPDILEDDEKTGLVEHFRELKRRITFIALTLIIGAGVGYAFSEEVFQFLLVPLADAMPGEGRRLIYTGLGEGFITYIKLSFFTAFIITFPVIAYHLYAFIAPGLYKKERKVFYPFLIMTPVLFGAGAAMAYYFIFPLAMPFFLGFENLGVDGDVPIQLEARVSEYLSLVINIILAFGVAFQMPVVLILLARVGFVTSNGLRKKRKYALVGVLILAAVVTPPDVISQIGLAIPLLLLYEISIVACGLIEKEKEKD